MTQDKVRAATAEVDRAHNKETLQQNPSCSYCSVLFCFFFLLLSFFSHSVFNFFFFFFLALFFDHFSLFSFFFFEGMGVKSSFFSFYLFQVQMIQRRACLLRGEESE